MNEFERQDSLEELNKKLYERNQGPIRVRRSELESAAGEFKRDWGLRASTAEVRPRRRFWSLSFLSRLFIVALFFFLISLGAAAFFLFRGSNVISNSNIDIATTGPLTVKSGDKFDLGIAVTNKNRVGLETADLIIEYPAGTRDPKDIKKTLSRVRIPLGAIKSGGTSIQGLQAYLFGQEKVILPISIQLEYRLSGSDATFEKVKNYEVQIADSPISVNIDLPTDINTDKDLEIKVEVITNSPTILKDAALAIAWPPGFTLKSSSVLPATNGQSAIWRLGDLPPGAKRTFNIVGTLDGQDAELKSFRFQVGLQESKEADTLAVLYTDVIKNILIQRPFVGLAFGINNDFSATPVARLGDNLSLSVEWGNSLPVPVLNGQVSVNLFGQALDKKSVEVNDGFYSSANNTITWDQTSFPALAMMNTGDRGNLGASFQSLAWAPGVLLRNPVIDITAKFIGERQNENEASQPIETTINKKLKLEAPFAASGRLFYQDGPFNNSGPIPPRVDQKTTYTAILGISTAVNDVKDVEYRATLPPYVKWTGKVSPGDERVSYDATNRLLTWKVSYLSAGSRGEIKSKETAIQLEFIPSANQIEKEPELIQDIQVTAIDTFTNTTIASKVSSITTRFSTDSSFRAKDELVTK